ncbi:MAG TPA: BBP7 family outer membrane beta-barrel protein [Lacipirellulaceae bacterium]|nr:BBP7 family outer membrane beta-barrel protein [Lacipirellulaceae bacterium]
MNSRPQRGLLAEWMIVAALFAAAGVARAQDAWPAGLPGGYRQLDLPPASAAEPMFYGAGHYGAVDVCTPSCAPPAAVPCPCPCPCVAPPPVVWGGRVGALLLFRDDGDHAMFSYDSAVETYQLLDARDAVEDFAPGVEARIVRFDLCALHGFEAVYWGAYPSDGEATVYADQVAGDLNPILNFDQLDYNGAAASAFVNDAVVHRLRSTSEFHNAELNCLWGWTAANPSCSPWTIRTLAGLRFFYLSDGLQFGSDADNATFTGEPGELYYTIDARNRLYGGQLGAYFDRVLARRWSLRGEVKAGVFANDASATSHIGGAAGTAVVNNGPNAGRTWYVDANKWDVAFLGEVRGGVSWQAAPRWRLVADYRVVAASGLALPSDQIYHDLRGLQDVELLATNGALLLHGAFVGAEWCF